MAGSTIQNGKIILFFLKHDLKMQTFKHYFTTERIISSRREASNLLVKNTQNSDLIRDYILRNSGIIALSVLEFYLSANEERRKELQESNIQVDYSVIDFGFSSLIDHILDQAHGNPDATRLTNDDLNMVGGILTACLWNRGIRDWQED